MAGDLGCLDAVRALFREPVRAPEPIFGKAVIILADTIVAARFGLHMVWYQSRDTHPRETISL